MNAVYLWFIYDGRDIDKKSLFRRHGHPPACLCVSARRQAGTGLK